MRQPSSRQRQPAARLTRQAWLVLALAGCASTAELPKATDSVATKSDVLGTSDAVWIDLPDPLTCAVGTAPARQVGEVVPNFHGCATAWPESVVEVGGTVTDDHVRGVLVEWGGGVDSGSTGQPLVDGEWLGLNQGLQGTGHVLTGLELELGDLGPTATIDLVTVTWYACDIPIAKPLRQLQLVRAAKPGWYAAPEPLFWLINMPIHLACGRWYQLQVFARRHDTQNWLKTDNTVRMYALKPFE